MWSSKIREGGKEKGRERERRDYFITHTAMSVCSSKSGAKGGFLIFFVSHTLAIPRPVYLCL